jgi:hypothetical protein
VDTPTDSAEGGVTTDETYSTDLSEVIRAVYPDFDGIEFVHDGDDDTDGDMPDNRINDTFNRATNSNMTAGEGNNQQFFIRLKICRCVFPSI